MESNKEKERKKTAVSIFLPGGTDKGKGEENVVGNEGGRCYGAREKERMKKVKIRKWPEQPGENEIKRLFIGDLTTHST